uniref:Uncharacterized protein n=1 Tax=Populus trichocarpa TaxID=3694 RepID=A0A2K1XQG7_POPTR
MNRPSNINLFLTGVSCIFTGCRFLPKLNNEINNTRNSAYKEWFASLENLVLIVTVSAPKKISRFGCNPDESFDNVFLAQETRAYIEDWIGLKTLDEAGK